ncbi:MAG: hypothetical protein K6V73_03825 [Firmicutes bacterium]|nr:hypothetical protein [Bacillota bacterium]
MTDTVERLARLIRKNPAIRAQEAADALGYAEPKALRYWLNKAGFRNFTEFRNRVLAGEYVPRPAAAEEHRPWPEMPGRLPLATRITAAGEPRFEGDAAAPVGVRAGPGAYAYRWSGTAYDAYLRPGSVLVVDAGARLLRGDLVLSSEPTEGIALWRLYPLDEGHLLVDPGNPRRALLPPESGRWRLLGRVVEVLAAP